MGWNNFPENWGTDVVTLEKDRMPQKYTLGDKYQCHWAKNNKLVWILLSINNDIVKPLL